MRPPRVKAEGEGFEHPMSITTHNGFQDRRLRPLGHPSRIGFLSRGQAFYHASYSWQRLIFRLRKRFLQRVPGRIVAQKTCLLVIGTKT